jgi:ankyrin repeat protein
LDRTYERTLLDIDDENWVYAHRLFRCIAVARRPLRIEELAEFLTFKSETGRSLTIEGNSGWRPENPRDMLLSTCSSLVAVINVDGSPVMQFSHFSVKEYLTSTRIAKGPVSRYYVPLEPANLFVAQACLSILLQLDKHVTKNSIEEFPLARYAGQYWAEHAEFGVVSSYIEDVIKRVFNPGNHHFAIWVWIYDTILSRSTDSEGPSRPIWAPLHYAAKHGFYRVAGWLITTCSQDVNVSENVSGWTPLHLASWFEHPKVTRLLLEHGADVDPKTRGGENPLRLLSARGGNLEVAKLLLEYGADPSVRSGSGRDSLYMALENGHPGLAQLLLDHGADPNIRDLNGHTLLHVSSQLGNPKVVQGLLKLDVDINPRDNRGRTPLRMALYSGHEQVVQQLLQHGADRT